METAQNHSVHININGVSPNAVTLKFDGLEEHVTGSGTVLNATMGATTIDVKSGPIPADPQDPTGFWSNSLLRDRFNEALKTATDYSTNPRNIEAEWHAVYQSVADSINGWLPNATVKHQVPFFSFKDASKNPDPAVLNKSVTLPHKAAKYCTPDIQNALRLEFDIPDANGTLNKVGISYSPILWELKRAASRQGTTNGFPTSDAAANEILQILRVAIHQVELQALLKFQSDSHLDPNLQQPAIIMVATAGPWLTMNIMRRDVSVELNEAAITDQIDDLSEREAELGLQDEEEPDGPIAKPSGSANLLGSVKLTGRYTKDWTTPMHIADPETLANLSILRRNMHIFANK